VSRPAYYQASAVQQLFISNEGDDAKSGLSRDEAIHSWRRLLQLGRGGTEWVLMEGEATQKRLENEASGSADACEDERDQFPPPL
jgi:hypothetical protein